MGDGEDADAKIAPLRRLELWAAAPAQEGAIAAGDQREAVLHEIDRRVAKGGGLPGGIRDARGDWHSYKDYIRS